MRGEKLAQAYEGAHDVDAWTSQRVISKELLRREPEHEVGGEALAVSFDRLVENARLHAVELGEVCIEQDLVRVAWLLRPAPLR